MKGKGGKVRIVPIEDDRITMMLERLLDKTERGHKLLVPDGIPTDRAINGMQQFILRHRDAILTPPHRTGALPSMGCGILTPLKSTRLSSTAA